jgi:hypothetical protein
MPAAQSEQPLELMTEVLPWEQLEHADALAPL